MEKDYFGKVIIIGFFAILIAMIAIKVVSLGWLDKLKPGPCKEDRTVTAIDYQLGGFFHNKAEYFVRWSNGSVDYYSDYSQAPFKIGDKDCVHH